MGQFDVNAAMVLVRIVEAGSFRAAAQRLGIAKTSVSRRVADLEKQLGAQLLRRTTRRLALTDAGAAFVERIAEAIPHLEAAEEAVSALQLEPRGRLRVTTSVPTGQLFLSPLIAEFLHAYPAVEVAVHLTDRNVDLVSERFDVAVRMGALPDSSLVAKSLGTYTYRLVASPDYLARRGRPKKPQDLAAHECLRFGKATSNARTSWSFGKGRRTTEVLVGGRLLSDDLHLLLEAANQGLGIARLPPSMVNDPIAKRTLVPILEDHALPPIPVHLVYVGGRNLPARLRAFLDFMQPRLSRCFADAEVLASPAAGRTARKAR
jgi:DNA-binding transcriptional LysR family regulator